MATASSDSASDKPPTREALPIEFYCDESCKNGHRYLVIGCLVILQQSVKTITEKLHEMRAKRGLFREMGWNVIDGFKFDVYESWLDYFDDLLKRKAIRFTALTIDTSQIDKKKWTDGPSDIGFNKLIYQLLLHKVGAVHGKNRKLFGYLDDRTTSHTPEELRKILNNGIAKDYGILTKPFRRLEFLKSHLSDLMQLCDILTGALGETRNNNATRAEKKKVAARIAAIRSDRFDVWDFKYKKRK